MQGLCTISVTLLFLTGCLFGQSGSVSSQTVEGVIVDSKGLPVIAANIYVVGSTRSTFISDTKGRFALRLLPGDHVVTVNPSNARSFKLFLRIPESGPVPNNLTIVLDSDKSCCEDENGSSYPSPIRLPRPPYPPAARAVRAEGEVEVLIELDDRGNVASAKATGGHPLLRRVAEQAAAYASFAINPVTARQLMLVYVFFFPGKDNSTERHQNPFRIEVTSPYEIIANPTPPMLPHSRKRRL
jgi:hypothetical protein